MRSVRGRGGAELNGGSGCARASGPRDSRSSCGRITGGTSRDEGILVAYPRQPPVPGVESNLKNLEAHIFPLIFSYQYPL